MKQYEHKLGDEEEGATAPDHVQLSEKGNQVKGFEQPKNFYWIYGLEEYLTHIDHYQLEVFMNIKKAILHGNIWKIKRLIVAEIARGKIELSEEFINILMAHFIGWEHSTHRKVLRYMAHCINSEYIRRISSWSIKWEERANLNDHFSRGQMRSKLWMVDKLGEVVPDRYLGTVAHYGGWYATIAQTLFEHFDIKKYYNLELDPGCIEIADDFNYPQYQDKWKFKSVKQDCGVVKYNTDGEFTIDILNTQHQSVKTTVKPDLIINTSCEHMNEDWFHNLPTGTFICLQTNDYFSNEQHVNCVENVQAAKQKYPMATFWYEGTLDTELYNRFMLIGEK